MRKEYKERLEKLEKRYEELASLRLGSEAYRATMEYDLREKIKKLTIDGQMFCLDALSSSTSSTEECKECYVLVKDVLNLLLERLGLELRTKGPTLFSYALVKKEAKK